MSADPLLLARAGFAGAHGLALSEFLSWDQHDQDIALAHQGYEARRCRSCGHHPDNGSVHAHIDVCPGCIALEQAQKEAKDVPGGHVRLAAGSRATCQRCIAEREANQPVTKKPTS